MSCIGRRRLEARTRRCSSSTTSTVANQRRLARARPSCLAPERAVDVVTTAGMPDVLVLRRNDRTSTRAACRSVYGAGAALATARAGLSRLVWGSRSRRRRRASAAAWCPSRVGFVADEGVTLGVASSVGAFRTGCGDRSDSARSSPVWRSDSGVLFRLDDACTGFGHQMGRATACPHFDAETGRRDQESCRGPSPTAAGRQSPSLLCSVPRRPCVGLGRMAR